MEIGNWKYSLSDLWNFFDCIDDLRIYESDESKLSDVMMVLQCANWRVLWKHWTDVFLLLVPGQYACSFRV